MTKHEKKTQNALLCNQIISLIYYLMMVRKLFDCKLHGCGCKKLIL